MGAGWHRADAGDGALAEALEAGGAREVACVWLEEPGRAPPQRSDLRRLLGCELLVTRDDGPATPPWAGAELMLALVAGVPVVVARAVSPRVAELAWAGVFERVETVSLPPRVKPQEAAQRILEAWERARARTVQCPARLPPSVYEWLAYLLRPGPGVAGDIATLGMALDRKRLLGLL